MNRIALLGIVGAFAAAAPTAAQAPRGTIAKNGMSYEVRIGKPKADVFGAALGVLADYQFKLTQSSQDGGTIQTDWRDPKQVDHEKNVAKYLFSSGDPVRLNMIFAPIGADSTRVVIRGDHMLTQIDQVMPLDKRTGKEWNVLTGVGDAIASSFDSPGARD